MKTIFLATRRDVEEFEPVLYHNKKILPVPIENIRIGVTRDGFELFYNNMNLLESDYIFFYPRRKYRDIFYTIARIAEQFVETSIKSDVLYMVLNKFLLLSFLQKNGIETVNVFSIAKGDIARELAKRLRAKLVIQKLAGSEIKIKSPKHLSDLIHFLKPGHVLFLKEIKWKKSVRCFALRGDVISYDIENGKPKYRAPSSEEKEICKRVLKAIGVDYCFLSLVKEGKKTLVEDVSLAGNVEAFVKITGRDPREMIAKMLEERGKPAFRGESFFKLIRSFMRWVEDEIGNIRSATSRI